MDQIAIQDLLLHSLRVDASPEAERYAALDETACERLQHLAMGMGVDALLYHALQRHGLLAALPPAIQQSLHGAYLNTAAHNLHLSRELGTITTALHTAQIPVMVLKGAYLVEAVYQNLALRPMGDLDFLIHPRHAQPVADILLGLGYHPSGTALLTQSLANGWELPQFHHPDGECDVEIHSELTRPNLPYSIMLDALWARGLTVRLAGYPVSAFCPEDLLLYLGFHLSYHHRFAFGLRPFCDIAWTIAHFGEAINWDVIVERAREWNWTRGVGLAFGLAREWLGAAVPDAVLRAMADDDTDQLPAFARELTFANPWYVKDMMPLSIARICARQPFRQRLRAFLSWLFISKEDLAHCYGLSVDAPYIKWYYCRRFVDACGAAGPCCPGCSVVKTASCKPSTGRTRWLTGWKAKGRLHLILASAPQCCRGSIDRLSCEWILWIHGILQLYSVWSHPGGAVSYSLALPRAVGGARGNSGDGRPGR